MRKHIGRALHPSSLSVLAATTTTTIVAATRPPQLLSNLYRSSSSSSSFGSSSYWCGRCLESRRFYCCNSSGMAGFSDLHFHQHADDFLERVETTLADLDESTGLEDVSMADSVLTIEVVGGEGMENGNNNKKDKVLPDEATFIINKQAPKRQLWLSSPISGPHHYDMVEVKEEERGEAKENEKVVVRWVSDKDGHDLQDLLEKELSSVLGVKVAF